jgi:hypothetical protein
MRTLISAIFILLSNSLSAQTVDESKLIQAAAVRGLPDEIHSMIIDTTHSPLLSANPSHARELAQSLHTTVAGPGRAPRQLGDSFLHIGTPLRLSSDAARVVVGIFKVLDVRGEVRGVPTRGYRVTVKKQAGKWEVDRVEMVRF